MTHQEKYLLLLAADWLCTFIFGCKANSLPLSSTLWVWQTFLDTQVKSVMKPTQLRGTQGNNIILCYILQFYWFLKANIWTSSSKYYCLQKNFDRTANLFIFLVKQPIFPFHFQLKLHNWLVLFHLVMMNALYCLHLFFPMYSHIFFKNFPSVWYTAINIAHSMLFNCEHLPFDNRCQFVCLPALCGDKFNAMNSLMSSYFSVRHAAARSLRTASKFFTIFLLWS